MRKRSESPNRDFRDQNTLSHRESNKIIEQLT